MLDWKPTTTFEQSPRSPVESYLRLKACPRTSSLISWTEAASTVPRAAFLSPS